MIQTVSVSRHIRCPADEASAVVTDPRSLLSKIEALSRCRLRYGEPGTRSRPSSSPTVKTGLSQ